MKRIVVTVCWAILLQACATEIGAGFHLPLGDPARGREAFVALRCTSCHFVESDGSLLPESAGGRVGLGGDTARVRTYGDLVTSIVNPSHEVAREYVADPRERNPVSPMASAFLNDVVTVQQLIDIVAFLQSAYRVVPPPVRLDWEDYPSRRTADPGAIPSP